MFSKVLILFMNVLISEALFEGEGCIKNGSYGVCKNLHKCQTSIDDLKRKINPQLCSFDAADPIVCCLDAYTAAKPGETPSPATTIRPPTNSTTEYTPIMYDYQYLGASDGQCPPLPESMTVKKTGQKALDKCVEYQERYVYPCEEGISLSLSGGVSRNNKCQSLYEELIVGGTEARRHEFPHMAMVGYGGNIEDVKFLCSGALISDRYVLTAGHCIFNRDHGSITYVLVGALNRRDAADRSKIYKVKNVIKHPEYKPPGKYNDIALIETEIPIPLVEFVVPACLPAGDAIDDQIVKATGWGLTQNNGFETLQKTRLHKLSTSECMQKFQTSRQMKQGFDPKSQSCYKENNFSEMCQGDSGGPIQILNKKIACMYTIVGVTSFKPACGVIEETGIYTKVINYVPWIESIVWPN